MQQTCHDGRMLQDAVPEAALQQPHSCLAVAPTCCIALRPQLLLHSRTRPSISTKSDRRHKIEESGGIVDRMNGATEATGNGSCELVNGTSNRHICSDPDGLPAGCFTSRSRRCRSWCWCACRVVDAQTKVIGFADVLLTRDPGQWWIRLKTEVLQSIRHKKHCTCKQHCQL